MTRADRQLVVLAFALALPARLRADDARLQVPYTMFHLRNGLTVVVHEDHSVPVATVNTWYHVGSSREQPGRTGLAHLFEHLMFEGSRNVPEGAFDRWLEAVGGSNNASTDRDRTNYWDDVPASALELPLFLEADRMGHLVDTMSAQRVDGQRDVVKNERRQSFENAPYGMASIDLDEALYPPDHPYRSPVIGSMEDLTAASHEDIEDFLRRYYVPSNATVVIAGDVDTAEVRRLMEKWFGDIPAGLPAPPLGTRPVQLSSEQRLLREDHVQLPRLYLRWPTPPYFSPADAALDALAGVLGGGKNARLYKRLVYELQVAQDVSAYQGSAPLGSAFDLVVTARSGHGLDEILRTVDEEILRVRATPPADRELARFQNQRDADFLRALESVGGGSGKANQLNAYLDYASDPDFFEEDLARYRALSPSDVQAAALQFLGTGRIALSVVPVGRADLALEGSAPVPSGGASGHGAPRASSQASEVVR